MRHREARKSETQTVAIKMKWCAQTECYRNKSSGEIHLTRVQLRAELYCLEECIFPLCLSFLSVYPTSHFLNESLEDAVYGQNGACFMKDLLIGTAKFIITFWALKLFGLIK